MIFAIVGVGVILLLVIVAAVRWAVFGPPPSVDEEVIVQWTSQTVEEDVPLEAIGWGESENG